MNVTFEVTGVIDCGNVHWFGLKTSSSKSNFQTYLSTIGGVKEPPPGEGSKPPDIDENSSGNIILY